MRCAGHAARAAPRQHSLRVRTKDEHINLWEKRGDGAVGQRRCRCREQVHLFLNGGLPQQRSGRQPRDGKYHVVGAGINGEAGVQPAVEAHDSLGDTLQHRQCGAEATEHATQDKTGGVGRGGVEAGDDDVQRVAGGGHGVDGAGVECGGRGVRRGQLVLIH